MALTTIIETYINLALQQAVATRQEDGSIAAYLPGFPGILGFGENEHACYKNLSLNLEAWLRLALAQGERPPVVGGIDLRTEAHEILASYSDDAGAEVPAPMYENEQELERAFAEWDAAG